MNRKLMAYLESHQDKYPYQLDAKYSRIVDRLVELWESPKIIAYFNELMIDNRGGRQGFPPEIAREIFIISNLHDTLMGRPEDSVVMWDEVREKAKKEIANLKFEFIPAHMFKAAELRDPYGVLLFLQAGMPVDIRDEREWTPLMVAAFEGNEAVARVLIEHHADPKARDRGGYSPLHWASLRGYADVVTLLIEKDADRNARSNSGWTPLLQAATKGHNAVVALLLEGDADPNVSSNDGWTPLHKAVANGHIQCARILMQAGASVAAQHQDGSTPLSLAEKSTDSQIRDILQHRLP